MIHNITFSIPEEIIVTQIPSKTKILSNLLPGNLETYIYNTEEEYYKEYQESMFAITKRKGGWDCLRHYEIIANGCIPYFLNIENCPINTMTLLPKELLKEANRLFETKFANKTELQIPEQDIQEYDILLTKLVNHLKNHLTTTKMANYILQKTNHTNVTKILYLSGDTSTDYLRCLTLHGFKTLYGKNCQDYPKIEHIYKFTQSVHLLEKERCKTPYAHLYGRGYTYSNRLDHELHDDNQDKTIEEDIKNKYYDIIIYGSYHRGTPYYDIVSKKYNPNEIIFLCGEDLHECDYLQGMSKGYNMFVREL